MKNLPLIEEESNMQRDLYNKVMEIVDWITAHDDQLVADMARENMNEMYSWHKMANGDTPEEGQVVIARTVAEREEYQILQFFQDHWHRQDGGGPCDHFSYVLYWKPFRGMM